MNKLYDIAVHLKNTFRYLRNQLRIFIGICVLTFA